MQKTLTSLQPGLFYHIYNRGNNREDLFREERNYRYFLQLYAHHVSHVADTFAYCLMCNHFHLLVRIKDSMAQTSQVSETCEVLSPSHCFSNLFNAYSKAMNKAYGRTGSLFQKCFGRIPVTSERYLTNLIFYIHFNPKKHGFVDDFREWQWSSYSALRSTGETKLTRVQVLEWFGNATEFEQFHRGMVDERIVAALIEQDL